MFALDTSPIAWLNRPYFDLSFVNTGAKHVYGIAINYNFLINDTQEGYGLQVNHSPTLRESLINETGLFQYKINNPLELPQELRTERWDRLCNYLTHYQELGTNTKIRLINLVRSLCFHQTVLDYVPPISQEEIARDPAMASLAWCREISSIVIKYESGKLYDLNEIELIASSGIIPAKVRLNAAIQLIVEYSKIFKDIEKAKYWRLFAEKTIEYLKPSISEFDYKLYTSIFYRAASFVPLLERNREKTTEDMELCELYGKSLTSDDEIQQIIAYENLNILTESRTKEALWLGDIDLASERSQILVEREPLDPRYRLELGEILIKLGKIEEAAKIYSSATKLGPPGTEIAWFMTGQCYEALGDPEAASNCYLASLRADPLAFSSLNRLSKLAPKLGNIALSSWCEQRLDQLEQQKKQMSGYKHLYVGEGSSELKIAGANA